MGMANVWFLLTRFDNMCVVVAMVTIPWMLLVNPYLQWKEE